MTLAAHLRHATLSLALALPGLAQTPDPAPPAPAIQVESGYLVVHLPGEGVTVVGQPIQAGPVDTGWATGTQRGDLLWRGEMTDGQGRRYNVRILPGYVAPAEFARDGWRDAGLNLQEYGQGAMWTTMGHHMRDTFKWGWKSSLWEFGIKGTRTAWADNFERAHWRTARKTFGWPLAYPWAFIAAAFESALRVPLGVAGALLGTASAGVAIPVLETAWPAGKALGNAGIQGVVLPLVAWTWHTLAAPPTALFASAPTPARADGLWMKVIEPKPASPPGRPPETVSEAVVADLARYATLTAALDADSGTSLVDLGRREGEELAAVRARYAAEAQVVQEARARKLQAWTELPENREAILRLAQVGGDAATIRAAEQALIQRLQASGLPEEQAKAAVERLAQHPLRSPVPDRAAYDKTDPLRGAFGTMQKVEREAAKNRP